MNRLAEEMGEARAKNKEAKKKRKIIATLNSKKNHIIL